MNGDALVMSVVSVCVPALDCSVIGIWLEELLEPVELDELEELGELSTLPDNAVESTGPDWTGIADIHTGLNKGLNRGLNKGLIRAGHCKRQVFICGKPPINGSDAEVQRSGDAGAGGRGGGGGGAGGSVVVPEAKPAAMLDDVELLDELN